MTGLAETYFVQEQFEEAEALLTEALAIYDQDEQPANLGKSQALRDLAWIYVLHQERIMEAEPLLLEAVAIRSEVLGLHPDTAVSNLDLGRFYGRMSNYLQAEPYYKEALEIYTQTLGTEHAVVERVLKEYAALLSEIEEKFRDQTDY